MEVKVSLPLLPLRDIVIFPSVVVPLFVGRKKSIRALEEVMKTDKSIILVAQKNSEVDEPQQKEINSNIKKIVIDTKVEPNNLLTDEDRLKQKIRLEYIDSMK